MSEICAYHECGHAVMAIKLGGVVHSLSIDPDWDDGPLREGDVEVHWPSNSWGIKQIHKSSIQVSLAGPAAEMVYTREPYHPALVKEWQWDWETAWKLGETFFSDERARLSFLEQTTRQIYQWYSGDQVWQAVAALADELLAHEILERPEIHDAVLRWL